MTANPKGAHDALRRLADTLADDILNAPDDEILSDAEEIYGDPDKLAARMLSLFEQVASEEGKARLGAARAIIDAGQRLPVRRRPLDRALAHSLWKQTIAAHPELTTAARKGEGLSDDDLRSMLEDLEELGLIQLPDLEDKKE